MDRLKKIFLMLSSALLVVLGFLVKEGLLSRLFSTTLVVQNLRREVVDEKEDADSPETSIFFVGDIMLDRGVELRMEKYGAGYPFNEISSFLREGDVVFGNLEGPIVEDPPHFPDASLQFAFSVDVVESLRDSGFNVLSLGNNHTGNMGKDGLGQTREFLSQAGIKAVGDPVSCSKEFLKEKRGIVFLSFNTTFPCNCSEEEIGEVVEEVVGIYPQGKVVVSLHWGREYENTSSVEQRSLAHLVIEKGADVVVGHHPHVVQEVERYGGGIIFYSLGNFIFDQDFSVETQRGLVVEMNVYPEKFVFNLFPVEINASQPRLLEGGGFLDDLAERSDREIREGIRKGTIELF